jgi:PP-loop superfamily ATP-utilizing enzyme
LDIARFQGKALRRNIVEKMKKIGFSFVTVDLSGYVQGSMNQGMKE